MNSKTTIILFILVVAVGSVVYVLNEKAPMPRPTVPPSAADPDLAIEKSLFEEDFGDTMHFAVKLPGKKEWAFERKAGADGALGEWRIVAPFEAKAKRWQVDQIPRRLTELKYKVKFQGTEGPIDTDTAGLNPPRAVVTLRNKDDRSVTVLIGRTEGEQETYVRVDDLAPIYRVNGNLKTLFEDSVLAYREQQLFDIAGTDIVQLSIKQCDGEEETTYKLVKTGTVWEFTSPAKARAVSEEVSKMCNSFGTLRVLNWVEEQADNPAIFGLDRPALQVTAVSQKKAEAKDADEEKEEEVAAELIEETHTVSFAAVGPFGEDNKVYVCREGDSAVGTVMKSVCDTFAPDLKKLRDNRIVTSDPTTARRVEVTLEGESFTLVRAGSKWSFADDGEPADADETSSLLAALRDMQAVNFVPADSVDAASLGFANPEASFSLAFDEAEAPTVVIIGGFADAATKRLQFVKTSCNESIAKMHVSEVGKVLRSPAQFRDRSLIDVPAEQFEEVSLNCKGTEGGSRLEVTLAKESGTWAITQPVAATANASEVTKLVDMLSTLRAEEIVKLAEGESVGDFGLDDPDVRLSYRFLPAETFVVKPPQESGDTDEPAAAQLEKVQPPAETRSLLVARKDSHVYVSRPGNEAVVYEVRSAVLDSLLKEFREKQLFFFDENQVASVKLSRLEDVQGFVAGNGSWEYSPEPDIPVDSAKVVNYLVRIKDLQAQRYVAYAAEDLALYGLDHPYMTLEVAPKNGDPVTLLVANKQDSRGQHYARMGNSSDVFLLGADAMDRLAIQIEEFEQTP